MIDQIQIDVFDDLNTPEYDEKLHYLIRDRKDPIETLMKAYAVWLWLTITLVLPAAWILFRKHTCYLNEAAPTILPVVKDGKRWRSPGLLRMAWVTFQLGVFAGLIFALVGGVVCLHAKTLVDSDLVYDWLIRNYLDFGFVVNYGGIMRDTLFWLIQ
jgi:hypothetical protein